jgi:hypothetical protein
VRLEAESNDPLVQVTAFRDDAQKRLVLVVINNAAEDRMVTVALKGLNAGGEITGEQSTEKVRWQGLQALPVAKPDSFKVTLPPLSVTSLATKQTAVQDKVEK